MKKNLTIITGIVLLFAMLAAGGCKNGDDNGDAKDTKKVTIYLKKIIKIGEETHLEMYNSYESKKVVVDSLWTIVHPGMKVIWAPEKGSGIKIIKKIGSSAGNGNIFNENASKVFLSKKFKFKVPENAYGAEKYDINFEDQDGNSSSIDPHLIIPDRKSSKDSEEEE